MTPAAFAWDVVLHDNLGPLEYRLNKLPTTIGQSEVYIGKTVSGGQEIQDCVAFWYPPDKALMLISLENAAWYGLSLIGYWGVTGGFVGSWTDGTGYTGFSVFFGPLAPESGGGDGGDAPHAK